jgi:hypothetical protein
LNVLVIPEARNDEDILKPIIKSMLAATGRPRAHVAVVTDPLIRGVAEAMQWATIATVIDQYAGMVDLFILIVDRDGDANRREALNAIERQAGRATKKWFLAEHAWQEIEAWAIAGQAELPAQWATIREEKDVKERYFDPLLRSRGLLPRGPHGRATLGREAGASYGRVRQLCPEVRSLEERVRALLRT